MAEDREFGFFGPGFEWVWIIVIIVLIFLFFPGVFGGFGYKE